MPAKHVPQLSLTFFLIHSFFSLLSSRDIDTTQTHFFNTQPPFSSHHYPFGPSTPIFGATDSWFSPAPSPGISWVFFCDRYVIKSFLLWFRLKFHYLPPVSTHFDEPTTFLTYHYLYQLTAAIFKPPWHVSIHWYSIGTSLDHYGVAANCFRQPPSTFFGSFFFLSSWINCSFLKI